MQSQVGPQRGEEGCSETLAAVLAGIVVCSTCSGLSTRAAPFEPSHEILIAQMKIANTGRALLPVC